MRCYLKAPKVVPYEFMLCRNAEIELVEAFVGAISTYMILGIQGTPGLRQLGRVREN
jgi:hypothetical protein